MPENNNIEISSVDKAIAEYEEMMNEAQNFAKEKLLGEMDDKLNSLVKDYINNKKESEKTNINESENKESIKVDKKKEMSDSKGVVNETFDLTTASINEIEAAFDNASSIDELEVVRDNVDMGSNGLNLANDTGDNDTTLETPGEPDDQITIDDIKAELESLGIDSLGQEETQSSPVVQAETNITNDPYQKIKQMHEELGNMIKEMEGQMQESELRETFNQKMFEMWGEGYEQKIGLDECGKMFETWKSNQAPAVDNGTEGSAETSTDNQIVAEDQVDESHKSTLSHNKKVGQEVQPRNKEYAENKFRIALQKESTDHAKKLAAVLKENKELNKKLNELKSEKKQLTESHDKLVNLNQKMKEHMKDMAVFNTNIAYTNNLLMNESLALTKEEKTKVIDKFKSVKTISESENTYKALVDEFKVSKKSPVNETTINEAVSTGTIIGESSVKAIEKTAFSNDPLARMKKVIANMEKRK
jgi:hypothetical protein